VYCRLRTHSSGFAPAAGSPISITVVCRKPMPITSPRTPPIWIRSPTWTLPLQRIAKYPANAVTTRCIENASATVSTPAAAARLRGSLNQIDSVPNTRKPVVNRLTP